MALTRISIPPKHLQFNINTTPTIFNKLFLYNAHPLQIYGKLFYLFICHYLYIPYYTVFSFHGSGVRYFQSPNCLRFPISSFIAVL